MSVISFKKQKLKKKEVDFKSIGALQGTLKYVTKKSIPTVEEKSVMIYTTDTAELFIGGGVGEPLKRLSDIIVVDNVNDLPEVGVKEKLYVSAADKVIYFWNGTDGFQQVGGGTGGGGSVIQTKIMEYPTAAEFPAEGQTKAIYIDKETDFLYRYDADTTKYIQLARQAADPTITARFNAIDKTLADKAAKTDLAGYRARIEKIAEADLDPATAAKLNANLAPYDDSALKSRISGVETSKADKTALDSYRKKTDAIAEADLDAGLKGKIDAIPAPYDDAAIKSSIGALEAGKADKSALLDYRKNSMKITEADLDSAAQTKLNAPGYDDTDIKADVAALQADAATKTELAAATADVLKKTDKIAETSLAPELAAKINAVPTGYDDSAVKADIQALKTDSATKADLTAATADCLKSTDKIDEAKLTPEVVAKLNKASEVYDDTAIKTDLTALKEEKANKTDLEHYRRTNVAIAESDLETALAEKINKAAPYDDTLVKNDISTLQSVKADKTELSKYRETSKAIDISDLAPTVVDKINSATPYDDTAIKNDIATDKTEITALKTNVTNNKNEIDILKSNVAATNANVETKADKAELDKYREKTVAIAESDLDASVQTKLNTVAAGGMQIMEYEVEGSVNGECWVVATGPGVKITKGTSIPGAGGGSILYPLKRLYIPDGVKVLSARIRFLKEEIASTNPGVAVDWDATRKDDTDNNFIPPLFQIWNDIPTARTIKWSLGTSVSYTNNHTIVFTGIGNGGAAGLNTIVKLIY